MLKCWFSFFFFFALNCIWCCVEIQNHLFWQSIEFYCYFMTKCILSSWHVSDTVYVCVRVCEFRGICRTVVPAENMKTAMISKTPLQRNQTSVNISARSHCSFNTAGFSEGSVYFCSAEIKRCIRGILGWGFNAHLERKKGHVSTFGVWF